MPTVSSYVGYSLEEPWGQPRVVFGLAAEDAEQLATLLERHDCVGPVYAAVTTGARPEPLPVPRQADAAAVEPPPAPQRPDDCDEPVFRQAAAAMADAAVVREIADRGAPPVRDDDDLADGELTADGIAELGPLALAASAARTEAEARIRAAITDYRAPGGEATQDIVIPRILATDVLEPLPSPPRPEAASGACIPPGCTNGELAADDQDHDDGATDPQDSGTQDRPSSGAKRGRAPRGYQIPRLAKSKRSRTAPDAGQPAT